MITALIPTFNCESTIRDTLESVKWVDRIFVVDSFSTDKTLEICREYTDWIVQHEYVNSATQKNWAMDQIETEWTLQIDSDESLEPGLRDEIIQKLARPQQPDGYQVRVKCLIWRRWVSSCGLYPSTQIRLFKTKLGRWSKREVHARLQGVNSVELLQHDFLHRDLESLSAELQQFSRQVVVWESNELIKKGKRWRWIDVTLRPTAIFFVYYFRRSGYRDGFRGFYLSVYHAFYSFMTYARLFESEVYRGLRK
ncbi:MAG: glycosyltransferase family 2 protein [Aggregatilineales bacterium]